MSTEGGQAHERLVAYMKVHGLKMTRQRGVILDVFLSSGKHLSVEDILVRVREREPGVGPATVYRTMRLLVECALAEERRFSTGATLYEPAGDAEQHHDHLICEACGTIVEFEDDEIERLQEDVAVCHGFVLAHHRMELYGLCPRCQDE